MAAERILMIDNYDSFTFNLVQYLGELGMAVDVVRNDEISADEAGTRGHLAIVISPGPGRPADAGITPKVVDLWSGQLPLLGVCLGHQAIGEAFGGRIVRAGKLMHGKTSQIAHTGHSLFAGIDSPFEATRYHSLVVDRANVPADLEVIATSEDGEIMAFAHRSHPTYGVQFHPESILTLAGKPLLNNFLRLARRWHQGAAYV
ncbi:MAG TPA: aminodeoxychorismate/anthranilate synthase component II [Vicinamibacterales bacterium]|nr:aminodeoxychorismate/anthranilate synthase component II [Vicinamibacterales bacterium]